MNLLNPSDSELNAAFAERVAGWKRIKTELHRPHGGYVDKRGRFACYADEAPNFTASADTVLAFLPKEQWSKTKGGCVWIDLNTKTQVNSYPESDSFPRACVIALLRAHGVEIAFNDEK